MIESKVLITGISSGLGYGFAQAFLEDGWTVFGVSRRTPENLPQPVGANQLRVRHLDLGDYDSIAPTLRDLLSDAPLRLDLVILNAGILGEIEDLRAAEIATLRHTMDVNVWANKAILDTIYAMRPPVAVDQVVAISSGAAVNGNRGWSGYSISKAALNMLTMLYAQEIPETHFTALAPGLIDTAMQDYMSEKPDAKLFPSVQRLRDARGTDAMPDPYTAARRIQSLFSKIKQEIPSGAFADVRKL